MLENLKLDVVEVTNSEPSRIEFVGKEMTKVKSIELVLNKLGISKEKVVAHGGVGLVLMSYFEGIPEDGNYLNFELGTGKMKEFNFEKILKR